MTFKQGIKDGIPICLGYLSVSFTFGMKAKSLGFPIWLPVALSMTNLTSAGQFAGLAIITALGSLIELAITTLIINLRYTLMSLSLSQRLDSSVSTLGRLFMAFGVTDEIYAVSMQKDKPINTSYFTGLLLTPYLGWALGTFIGAGAAELLPTSVRSAMGIAIYGMFLAIIIPPAQKSRPVLFTIFCSAALSCLFRFVPVFKVLSVGWVIIICTIIASGLSAFLFPLGKSAAEEEDREL